MGKVKATIGVFAGIINEEGKILLRRREEIDSITGKSYKGDWELPGGGVVEAEKITYDHLVKELIREVKEEIGISISVDPMPEMYPLLFKGPQGYDLALVVPIRSNKKPSKGETIYVSPKELKELAEKPKGQQLLSGWGKRMCCMALKAHSFGTAYYEAKEAGEMLFAIQKEWRI